MNNAQKKWLIVWIVAIYPLKYLCLYHPTNSFAFWIVMFMLGVAYPIVFLHFRFWATNKDKYDNCGGLSKFPS